jgi:hypothetical protein
MFTYIAAHNYLLKEDDVFDLRYSALCECLHFICESYFISLKKQCQEFLKKLRYGLFYLNNFIMNKRTLPLLFIGTSLMGLDRCHCVEIIKENLNNITKVIHIGIDISYHKRIKSAQDFLFEVANAIKLAYFELFDEKVCFVVDFNTAMCMYF